jgi:hypothetical protein
MAAGLGGSGTPETRHVGDSTSELSAAAFMNRQWLPELVQYGLTQRPARSI